MHYLRYSIITSHIYFSVHYTGSYTGNDAVLAMLFPIRIGTSCGNLYLPYLRILCTACSISSTDQLAVRGL